MKPMAAAASAILRYLRELRQSRQRSARTSRIVKRVRPERLGFERTRRELMFINPRSGLLILILLVYSAAASAGPGRPQTQPAPGRVLLDVVVTAKSGVPARGLQQQDFTLSDNKLKQTINSFQAVDGRQAPIDVIIVIDAVNASYSTVGFEREQIDKVLRADQGKLAYPVSLAVLTDTDLQIVQGFSSDGNALSAALDQYANGLRNFRSSGGFFEADQVFEISLRGLQDLIDRESARSSAGPYAQGHRLAFSRLAAPLRPQYRDRRKTTGIVIRPNRRFLEPFLAGQHHALQYRSFRHR